MEMGKKVQYGEPVPRRTTHPSHHTKNDNNFFQQRTYDTGYRSEEHLVEEHYLLEDSSNHFNYDPELTMKFSYLLFLSQCPLASSFTSISQIQPRAANLFSSSVDDALEKTKNHLKKLSGPSEFEQDEEVLYKQFIMKPATELKDELKKLKLQNKGRKPDLARRLVEHHINMNKKEEEDEEEDGPLEPVILEQWNSDHLESIAPLKKFAKLPISNAAGTALARAGFTTPTPIQASALPLLTKDKESLILHAETGSGKTLCYLLPITEKLWRENDNASIMNDDSGEPSYALILTPSRELAAQVAGVATCLAPPGSVRLITTPTNLVRDSYENKEKSEGDNGGRLDNVISGRKGTKLIIGSAKSVMLSLFGDDKLHPPTSKPEAKKFLSGINYIVLDEVGTFSLLRKKIDAKNPTCFISDPLLTLAWIQIDFWLSRQVAERLRSITKNTTNQQQF